MVDEWNGLAELLANIIEKYAFAIYYGKIQMSAALKQLTDSVFLIYSD